MDPSRHMNVLASTKFKLQVEKMQIGNIRIFYFKDKSTRISQLLACVSLHVLGVFISEKAGWYRQKKISRHFLSELAEHDSGNSTPAKI